jgi:nitroimidazol reductase NimA-like FMN-containing flavoprotein (pyridoxamine 5'-phosphate oxidase superfamily)
MRYPLLGHIGVLHGDRPHVTPIWVYYENDAFFFSTRTGRVKGGALKSNPKVALSIATDTNPYRAIVVEGTAHELEGEKAPAIFAKLIDKYVGDRFGKSEAKKLLEKWKHEPDRTALVIKVDRLLSWDYSKGDQQRQDEGISMSMH